MFPRYFIPNLLKMRRIRFAFYVVFGMSLFLYPGFAIAQMQVVGRVLDRTTRDPLPSVTVVNLSGHLSTVTDAGGGFHMPAVLGDKILFSLMGYKKDTLVIGMFNANSPEILLSSLDFRLPEVTVFGQKNSYGEDSASRYQEYAHLLDQSRANGFSSPVDALYDVLSKKRKQVWRFQKMFRQYEQQKYLESRITPKVVARLTGLQGDSLQVFLNHYHIDYFFARNASDIVLYEVIRQQAEAYRRNQYPFSLLREIK